MIGIGQVSEISTSLCLQLINWKSPRIPIKSLSIFIHQIILGVFFSLI